MIGPNTPAALCSLPLQQSPLGRVRLAAPVACVDLKDMLRQTDSTAVAGVRGSISLANGPTKAFANACEHLQFSDEAVE